MTDDKMPPEPSDRPEQEKSKQAREKIGQNPASEAAPQGQRPSAGRRPLFRN